MPKHGRWLGVLLAGAVLVGACGGGGDDGADDAPSPGFCTDVATVQEEQAALSDLRLTDDDDVPDARAQLLEFLDAIDAMAASAPEEVRAEADQLAATSARIRPEIEGVDDALELGTQVPGLLSELGAPATDLTSAVRTTCGGDS